MLLEAHTVSAPRPNRGRTRRKSHPRQAHLTDCSNRRLQRRLSALRNRHTALDLRVELEQKKRFPDDFQIQRLKRLRLLVKDEIQSTLKLMGNLRRSIRRSGEATVTHKNELLKRT